MNNILLIQFLRLYGEGQLHSLNIEHYPWELLIRQSRRANLISRVAVFLQENELLNQLPPKARQHFLNALQLARANARAVKWEVYDLYKILHKNNIEFVLLKGAAYIYIENNAAKGRLFSDTDILTRHSLIEQTEKLLVHSGWFTSTLDPYTQKYYRQWMHEIPPLHHLQRHTTLDLHHSILPPTSPEKLDPQKLWDNKQAVADMPGLYTLSETDMILHSAAHLFHEGEFKQGLRDLSDLDLLIRQYITEEQAWESLLKRAIELNLERSLYYALNYCTLILKTPVPASFLQQSARAGKLNIISNYLMNTLFLRALIPRHSSYTITGAGFAEWLLYIRSHWIRMPWYLLIPHLSRKAWLQALGKKTH